MCSIKKTVAAILLALASPAFAQTTVVAFYICDSSGCFKTHEFKSFSDCMHAGPSIAGRRQFQCVPEIKR